MEREVCHWDVSNSGELQRGAKERVMEAADAAEGHGTGDREP